MDKTKWFMELYEIFATIQEHEEKYDWKSERLGFEIEIHPHVFSPKYFQDSEWYAEKVGELVKGKDILEVGSGTGLLSVHAHKEGAKRVRATDINMNALLNTKYNFTKHGMDQNDAQPGDPYFLMGWESNQHDIIVWNHPFNHEIPAPHDLLKAAFDYQFQGLEKYVSGARTRLKENGRLLLGSGNYANPDLIKQIADDNNYNLEIIAREEKPLSTLNEYPNELLLYEFKDKKR